MQVSRAIRAEELCLPTAHSFRQPTMTLTEVAGCIMLGTALLDMWFGIESSIRAGIYLFAVALAFVAGGFRPRLTAPGCLFLLVGGLYLFKALLYPPVPKLVKSDIRNILVGLAFLCTLGLPDLPREAWERFQIRTHRTVLIVSTLGAVLGLGKLLYYDHGGIVPQLMNPERGYPLGTSLQMDYNFYSLPLLLGLLSAFWLIKRDSSRFWCSAGLLCVPELSFAVLLSGSRRGFITVCCIVPVLSVWLIVGRRKNHQRHPAAGLSRKALFSFAVLVLILAAAKLETLSEFATEVTAGDSFANVLKRWETFEEGTYSESRMHYWSVSFARLSRFDPLEYILGQGFAYVTDLGANMDAEEDYPHNFLLSSLLYGGVTQTTCLVAMISVALVRLSRRTQRSGMFAAWFFLVLLFLFTSCNSFFSSEIAIFLTVIALGINRCETDEQGLVSSEAWVRFRRRQTPRQIEPQVHTLDLRPTSIR
jgi:hypothetical protein